MIRDKVICTNMHKMLGRWLVQGKINDVGGGGGEVGGAGELKYSVIKPRQHPNHN